MTKRIGILTAGGDSPGLNAAIRAIGKTALANKDMSIIGFRDGFRGLMENRTMRLDHDTLSSILTTGGTGFTGRDVTVEAIEPLFEKKMDGFSTVFHQISFAKIGTSTVTIERDNEAVAPVKG